MMEEKWYVAVLVLQSRVGTWDDDPLVDHQVRILRASSAEVAFERATALGAEDQTSYRNEGGGTVYWDFLGLPDLQELSDAAPEDGDEIFSWRTRGPGRGFVRSKNDLSVFAEARDAHKTARELLDE